MKTFIDKSLRFLFNFSMIVKGIDGIIEFAAGIAFLCFSNAALLSFYVHIIDKNIIFISKELNLHLTDLATTYMRIFVALILILTGLIKMLTTFNLFFRRLWVFPIALVLITLLILYGFFQSIQSWSLFLLIMAVSDVIVALLIWREYRLLKKKKDPKDSNFPW